MPFKMKGTAMYDKVKNDRGISSMRLKSPMDHKMTGAPEGGDPHAHVDATSMAKMKSPMDKSPMDKSPMDKSPKKMKSPMDKSPMDRAYMKLKEDSAMDKSPMDHAHGAMNMSHMKLKKDSAMDMSHMKLKKDSAMDMSHMKLTQDAAMKLTSAMKKKLKMVKGPDGNLVPEYAVDGKGAGDLKK